jgi:hypothetical protein
MAFHSSQWMYNSGFFIPQSILIDNVHNNEYLETTFAEEGDQKTWTWSGWIKRGNTKNYLINSDQNFFCGYTSQNSYYQGHLQFKGADDRLALYDWGIPGGGAYGVETVNRFTDTASWYHVVCIYDSTQYDREDRIQIWVNGTRQELQSQNDWGDQGYPERFSENSNFNGTGPHFIGADKSGGSAGGKPFSGYIAEVHFIDGQALTPDHFAETDTIWGHWIPKKFNIKGTPRESYGTNGFYLEFENPTEGSVIFNKTFDDGDVSGLAHSSIVRLGEENISRSGRFAAKFYWPDNTTGSRESKVPLAEPIAVKDIGTFRFSWYLPSLRADDPQFGLSRDVNGSNFQYFSINFDRQTLNTIFYYRPNASGTSYDGVDTGVTAEINTWYTAEWTNLGNGYFQLLITNETNNTVVSQTVEDYRAVQDFLITDIISVDSDVVDWTWYIDDFYLDTYEHKIGADTSGNLHHFWPHSITPYNIHPDSPSNNFNVWATNERIYDGRATEYSYGGQRIRITTGNGGGGSAILRIPTEGKWYFEHKYEQFSVATTPYISINNEAGNQQLRGYGQVYQDSILVADLDSVPEGGIVGVVVDVETNQVSFYINGTHFYTVTSSATLADAKIQWYLPRGGASYPPGDSFVTNFGQNPSFLGQNPKEQYYSDDSGYGLFQYSQAVGCKCICTNNLPEPLATPKENFNTVLYGASGVSQTINGVGFNPDFVFLKPTAGGWGQTLIDKLRRYVIWDTNPASINNSSYPRLSSNLSGGEVQNGGITGFHDDGFYINTDAGYINASTGGTGEVVAWCWKANGEGETNNDGSGTATVSANPNSGFSIVKYTGSGSDQSIGHGLGKTPQLIICKNRNDSSNWSVNGNVGGLVYGSNKLVFQSDGGIFADGNEVIAADSSTFTVGGSSATNGVNDSQIAYCFTSVPGMTSIGTYVGTGDTDGEFVHCGFKPAFIMIKHTGTQHWIVVDSKRSPVNPGGETLFTATDDPEYTSISNRETDFLSNGFRIRAGVGTERNESGVTYIYMAFAEQPVKYTNAHGDFYKAESLPEGNQQHEITQSLRFEEENSAGMTKSTPMVKGNNKKWTMSLWFKRGDEDYFNTGGSAAFRRFADFWTSANSYTDWGTIGLTEWHGVEFLMRIGGSNVIRVQSGPRLRDPSAWYHFVLSVDTEAADAEDRVKMYFNGVRETNFRYSTYPSQDLSTHMNTDNSLLFIGRSPTNDTHMHGYLADFYHIDGESLDAEDFGYFDESYGDWRPRLYDGRGSGADFGPNGFHLEFNASAIGNDSSDRLNHFTTANLDTYDVVLDTPTNNFAVLNPNERYGFNNNTNYKQGNLKAISSATSGDWSMGTISVTEGKWYWETRFNNMSNGACYVGVENTNTGEVAALGHDTVVTRLTVTSGSNVGWSNLDIIGCALDLDEGTMEYFKNGSSFCTVTIDVYSAIRKDMYAIRVGNSLHTLWVNFGQEPTMQGAVTPGNYSDSNGQGAFIYEPPAGFLAMCTKNLSSPVVPKENFNNQLYTGTSLADNKVSTPFAPDFVWLKRLSGATGHWRMFDSVRGDDWTINSSSTYADYDGGPYNDFHRLADDGFVLGYGDNGQYYNQDGNQFLAWSWKAGDTTVNNNDGSIQSTVLANPENGLSIVSYVGTGSNGTVGHGLGRAPSVILIKNRTSGGDWGIWHSGMNDANKRLTFNNLAAVSSSTYWNSTEPTATEFSVGTAGNINENNSNFIAYCFANIPGMAHHGRYQGNGNVDGTMIYTGFRPAMVMIKLAVGSTQHWYTFENAREPFNDDVYDALKPSTEELPYSANNREVDLVSNGFKIRDTDGAVNLNGGTYVYMAFAENPFKHTTAR